jgi:hypothetical protein
MDWRNSEHYPDPTAALAMSAAADRPEADALDAGGCERLSEAVVRLAAEDYLCALRHLPQARAQRAREEIEAFFRSPYFRRLTGLRGDVILRKIRKECEGL